MQHLSTFEHNMRLPRLVCLIYWGLCSCSAVASAEELGHRLVDPRKNITSTGAQHDNVCYDMVDQLRTEIRELKASRNYAERRVEELGKLLLESHFNEVGGGYSAEARRRLAQTSAAIENDAFLRRGTKTHHQCFSLNCSVIGLNAASTTLEAVPFCTHRRA